MNAKIFMSEMQSVIDQFEKRAASYGTIGEDGVEICFVGGYAVLHAEIEDDGEILVCKQEVELLNGDTAPVCPLHFAVE